MVNTSIHLREELPPRIVRGANLESTMRKLLDTFSAGREKNAELINNFLDQPYFKGEESLIDKLIKIKPSITFDEIGDEGINLASAVYNNKILRELKDHFDETSDDIKKNFIDEIFNKVQTEIGTAAPYNDFATECAINPRDNILSYLDKIVTYLTQQESKINGRNTIEILKKITITNNDLNRRLPTPIAPGTLLTSIPMDIKSSFDHLLSFEIGKEADRTLNIVNTITGKLGGLVSNSFPAINTIISEHPEYKYEESKLGPDFKQREQAINNDKNLTSLEKKEKINDLKRELYIKYLKTKNSKIGDALEELYNNNFDYSKVDQNILKSYIDRVIDFRIRDLYNTGAHTILKLNYINLDDFTEFYKELARVDPANPTNTVIHLTDVTQTITRSNNFIDIPIYKSIIKGENPRLKDIDQYGGDAKSFDTIPFRYEIKQSDIDNLDISMEDRVTLLNYLSKFKSEDDKYTIEGKDVGRLIYLFFVVNNKSRITEFNPDKQKEVENVFGKVQPSEHKENLNDAEKFKNDIEKMGTGVKFENGAEIWMPMGDSDLPGGGYQWMKVKISDVDMKKGTFKGTIFGGELKLSNHIEGKSRTFDMNDETIEQFKVISKNHSGKIRLLPNPSQTDFNSFRNNLQNHLGTSKLDFPIKGTTWDGNKFKQKILDENDKEKEVEVKYFGTKGDNKTVYKIEYNPIKKSFTVSSTFNGEVKGKNGKSEKKRFSYKRDMDWNNFLIFFTQKGLTPKTEEEANIIINQSEQDFKMVNGGHPKLNRFSINNIKNVVKTIKGNIKKKIDEYNKSQDEELEDILVGDWGLYSKLAGVLGFIPSIKGGLGELQQEYYNNRDGRTWKKIEGYLKIFQSDPDFGTTFEQVPPFAKILGGKSYKAFIMDLAKPNISRSTDDIHKAAALLLANIEKGSSPYRGLSGEENSGLWVRILLGDAHYEQFMRDKQKCIDDLKQDPKEKDQIQDVLATCEMDYIINNVNGANGKLKYFGSHEGRGIPGKEGTDYIDNPSKRLLSDKFAKTLKDSYKGRFNGKTVESAFDDIKHNDFNLAKEDFKKLLKSSRFPGAIANLKKMFMLAKTPEHKSEYQKCFLVYMLSGVLDVNGKKDLRKQTYQWAKTMSFLPGMLAKETSHSQKVVTLLDDWSGGDFSKNIKSYFHEGDLKNGKLNIENLIKELDSRWSVKKMEDFEKYSKSIFPSKTFPENSALKKLQDSCLDTGMENMDNSLLDNPLVANSGGLLSNTNVVHDRMAIRDGEFDGKDPDERNNRKEFWAKITDEVNHMSANNVQDVKLLLRQYCNWFGLSDGEEIYKWIKTAYYRRDYTGKEITYKDGKGNEDSMGTIGQREIDSIIRYTFKGKVMNGRFRGSRLPKEMHNALDAFQNKFQAAFNNNILKNKGIISDIFKIGNESNIQVLGLGSRSSYNTNVTGRENSDSDDDTKAKNRIKRNFISGNFINYYIANIEKSFRNLPSSDYVPVTTSTLDNLLNRFNAI